MLAWTERTGRPHAALLQFPRVPPRLQLVVRAYMQLAGQAGGDGIRSSDIVAHLDVSGVVGRLERERWYRLILAMDDEARAVRAQQAG